MWLGWDDEGERNIVTKIGHDRGNLNPDPDGDYISNGGIVEELRDESYTTPYLRIKYEVDIIEKESELDPLNHNHSWYFDWLTDQDYPKPETWDQFSPQYITLIPDDSYVHWQFLYPFDETESFPNIRNLVRPKYLDYILQMEHVVLGGEFYTTDFLGAYGPTIRYKFRNRDTGVLMWEIAFKYVPQLANPIQYVTHDAGYWGQEDGSVAIGEEGPANEWYHERYIQVVDWDNFEILDTPPVITCSIPSNGLVHTVQRDGVDYYSPIPLITFAKFNQLYHGSQPVAFWEARDGIFQK
jgi:hypothetical protein